MARLCIILFLLTTVLVSVTEAQEQKTGYIDSGKVVERMPEYQGIEQRLEFLKQTWQEELNAMEQRIEDLEREYGSREILYTEEMRQRVVSEITELRAERDLYLQEKFGPDGEYFRREQELLEPVQRQVFEAVRQVASREGIDFVFDQRGEERLLWADPRWDLTEAVLMELGLQPLHGSVEGKRERD